MLTAVVAMVRKNGASTNRRLHRSLGAIAAVFILFMVLSGIVINHSNDFGLDQRHVDQPFLLDWYGLGAPEDIRSFAVGNRWISFAGSQLFLDDTLVSTVSGGIGAVASGEMLVAASSDELLLLDTAGQLIERVAWSQPGAGPIESIGLSSDGNVAIRSSDQLWLADAELLTWQLAGNSDATPAWSSAQAIPDDLGQAITRQYRGDGLSVQRVLLDLHSGRAFGRVGVFVYDLLALIAGFLAVSGLILWWRAQRNGKRSNGVK